MRSFGGILGENIAIKGENDQFCQKIRFLSKFWVLDPSFFPNFPSGAPKYWLAQSSGLISIIYRWMNHQISQLWVFWWNQLAKIGIKQPKSAKFLSKYKSHLPWNVLLAKKYSHPETYRGENICYYGHFATFHEIWGWALFA